jgi:hopene-associated glycosyltransferase HpnB
MILVSLIVGLLSLAAWCFLAVAHGAFWKPLLPTPNAELSRLPSVDIIVPARNEADALPASLPSLLAQEYKGDWRVIVVDDNSQDGTSAIARRIAARMNKADRLVVLTAPPVAAGWKGKVAAMNEGVTHSQAELVLFTDADIRHSTDSLHNLVARVEAENLDLASRMVRLNCTSFAEKLLIPAFVFFFAKLYPFRRANNPKSHVAAAAGGTMLVRRSMLDKIGGLASIKSALIDDCGLARVIKDGGGKIELTLTNDIDSLRPYPHIRDVWHMVSRTAYTQLRHNPYLLAGTTIGMALLYLAPPLLFLFAPSAAALGAGAAAWIIMTALYLPMIRFYRLPVAWALTLPVAALVYGGATLDSARLFYQGKGGQWKDRAQDGSVQG